MSPDQIFSLCNTLALLGWLVLIVLPQWQKADAFLIGILIVFFAILYGWLVFSSMKPGDLSKFGSLDGVMSLFTDKRTVTAGWLHYLAFDLMIGIFIRKNAAIHGIGYWLVLPCLLLTFMLGPLGLLLYLLIRWIRTGYYFSENYR